MALEKATAEITDSQPLTITDVEDIRNTLKVNTLVTSSNVVYFEQNSIHGTKDIPLSTLSFLLDYGVVGNVAQVWFQGNSLPSSSYLHWTDGADEDFEPLTLYLLTFNLHPDNVIVGTINTI